MTFQDWLFRLCETESPGHSIIAYRFGLFERENEFAIYLMGSSEYKMDDEDWAIRNDFEPGEKQFVLSQPNARSRAFEDTVDHSGRMIRIKATLPIKSRIADDLRPLANAA